MFVSFGGLGFVGVSHGSPVLTYLCRSDSTPVLAGTPSGRLHEMGSEHGMKKLRLQLLQSFQSLVWDTARHVKDVSVHQKQNAHMHFDTCS